MELTSLPLAAVCGAWKRRLLRVPARHRVISPLLLASLVAVPLAPAQAVVFTDVGAGLPQVTSATVPWGDYDNDGDLDILLQGKVYRNSGGPNPTFSDIGAGLPTAYSALWGDFDNDGNQDILLARSLDTRVYRNSGGANPTFSDMGAGLPGRYLPFAALGDYDNDGDLDILLAGNEEGGYPVMGLYRNSGGPNPTFSGEGGLVPLEEGSLAWGDYDNDGDLDILMAGGPNPGIARVYRNNGPPTWTFSDIGAGLPGVWSPSVAWGDYDNDGNLDILLTGYDSVSAISKVYRNSGGPNPTFTDIGAGLEGLGSSSAAWGDFDNDGNLDMLLTGNGSSSPVSKVYANSGGPSPTFSDVNAGLTPTYGQNHRTAWADYDNDGDLDILLTGWTGPVAKLYRNSEVPANTPPSAPSGLAVTIGPSGTTFSWNAASDAETPAAGLTYNLRVGTTPGGGEILSPMSAANGFRKVVQMGNAGHRLSWTLAVPPVNYYWSVQAVDGAFAGSPFAAEHQTVGVPGPAPVAPGFALNVNRPNPFSGMTRIVFELPHEARVRLEVHDLAGRRVQTLVDGGVLPAGRREVEWDGRGPRGERARDGVYFCVMEADGFRSTQRMVLAR